MDMIKDTQAARPNNWEELADKMLDEIEALSARRDALIDEADAVQAQIREKAIYCRNVLGNSKMGIVSAANISRPTLDAWLSAAA